MNDTATPYQEYVFRRLVDPVEVFGWELPPMVWVLTLGIILVVAFFYVGWMYRKDSRGVGPWWATFLGVLRISVYLILALVFLLPAIQTGEDRTLTSKVVLLLDASRSMQETRDDLPDAARNQEWEDVPTRQDKVLSFIRKDDFAFIRNLENTNPITAYRFGARVDDAFLTFADGRYHFRDEWEQLVKQGAENVTLPERKRMPAELWTAWLKPSLKEPAPEEMQKADRLRFDKLVALNEAVDGSGIFRATNVMASSLATFDREINNLVQGIVLVSDGHSTSFSQDALDQLVQRARRAKIPIFVVGVGAVRPTVRVDIVSVRLPTVVRPDDKFRAVVELTGEGLAEKEQPVFLDLTHVATTRKSKDDIKGQEKEEDIVLVERLDKKEAGREPVRVSLGKKITLQPQTLAKLSRDALPRAEVELLIDAQALAEAAGVDLEADEKTRGRKWDLDATRADPSGLNSSELRFVARTPRDPGEIFPDPFHLSRPTGVQVVKKELSVLLFASGPERDYQFLRTMLVREVTKGRARLAIYMQKPPGVAERREGVVQDVDPKRLLTRFPDRFDLPSEDEEQRVYDLAEYDVIVAFDPDWNELTSQQVSMLERWVDRGGGLVVVGGPINTLQLARPGAEKDKLRAIIELYPVLLEDVRVKEMDRKTDTPWPLVLDQATPEMEFLRLKEDVDTGTTSFQTDWASFYGKDEDTRSGVKRGFYRYYPIKQVRQGALPVARFTDPEAKMEDGTQMPYIVLSDPASGRRVVWIGSGEMWRLRMYSEAFHERFWTKLARYAGAGSQGRTSQRIRVYLSRVFKANQFVSVDARIDGKGGQPLAPTARPQVQLQLPAGTTDPDMETRLVMKPKPGGDGWFNATFQVRSAGEYKLELTVPDTSDSESRSFTVEEAQPEVDETAPDFDSLYQLASEADEVLARIRGRGDRDLVEQALRSAAPAAAGTETAARRPAEKLRLYFSLEKADLIPRCMISDPSTQRVRGPVKDLWDDGFVLWERDPPEPPVKLSYILVLVVGLLSVEWLTRKLLRLA